MAANTKNTGIKRILADVRELEKHPSSRYHAAPLEDNMFEWHFTIRGPSGSDFEGGMYHGRILLPAEYPFKPPNIIFLTKNGRFEVGTKICLSISAYHEESWQPAWGVRTMLEAIISFLPSEGAGAIGALDWSKEERQKLAVESHKYNCPTCGKIHELLTDESTDNEKVDEEIAQQVAQLGFTNAAAASPGPSATRQTTGILQTVASDSIGTNLSMETPEKSSNSIDLSSLHVDSNIKESLVSDASIAVETISLENTSPAEIDGPSNVTSSNIISVLKHDRIDESVDDIEVVKVTELKSSEQQQQQQQLLLLLPASAAAVDDAATIPDNAPQPEEATNQPAAEAVAAARQSPQYDIVDGFLVSAVFGLGLVLAILILKKILKYIGDTSRNSPQSFSTEF